MINGNIGRVVLLILMMVLQAAHAAPMAALGYTAKYLPGFSHFDYVNPDAPKGGELVMSAFGTFETLNPFLIKSLAADGIRELVFDTLVEKSLDEPFSVYGLLADDIQLAEDGLSVVFRLNPLARFSDGSPVTSDDVKFSFDQLMSERATPQYRVYWADVKDAQIIDQRHIRFNFRRVNPELHLIIGELPVFSRQWIGDQAFDKVIDRAPIGSGPYRVESYTVGKVVRYRRDAQYWAKGLNVRKGMFNFDRVVFKYYKDLTVALEAFKAGEFDFRLENHSKRWARDYVGSKFEQGLIKKTQLKHSNNAGIQGFAFNVRRPLFEDKRVRQAITLALDFEWSNKNLFYGQYRRCYSYFSNSELAATGVPSGEELVLLNRYKTQLDPVVFGPIVRPPSTAPPHSLRDNLLQAKHLLEAAGWRVKDGALQNDAGQRFSYEIMLSQKGFERIVAPFAYNLSKLGIQVDYRTVDTSLYQRRVDTYDFDMIVVGYGQSQSPGNELRSFFYSGVADQPGGRNLIGIEHPVVDALVDEVVYAKNRSQLIHAARALDRVLLHNVYLVPHWYIDMHRVAYWDKFQMPKTLPLYYQAEPWVLMTWWAK